MDLIRSFRKLLNPHQVYDLMNGGPLPGFVLELCHIKTWKPSSVVVRPHFWGRICDCLYLVKIDLLVTNEDRASKSWGHPPWFNLLLKPTANRHTTDWRCLQDGYNCGSFLLEIIFTMRHYASAVYAVIVSPSICLSVTCQYCTKTAKPRMTQTVPYDSPWTPVFWF